MSIPNTLRYSFILIFSLLASGAALAQADTVATDTTVSAPKKKVDSAGHQLCIGIDIYHPVVNLFLTDRTAYEIAADYYLHNEFYAAAEGGWGNSWVNYPDLRYNTKNSFLRLGFNKAILPRDNLRDWDMLFFGLRVGAAQVNRSGATFMIADSVWGNTHDSSIARRPTFIAVWAELTAGVRVEVVHGIYAGWNVRGKFMMNSRSFKDLAPLYIAGYGKGDKNSSFDLNVYLSYTFRWQRRY